MFLPFLYLKLNTSENSVFQLHWLRCNCSTVMYVLATTQDSSGINHFYYCRKFSWATLPVPQRERHFFPYQRDFTLFRPALRLLTQYQGHGHMEHIEFTLIFFLSLSIPPDVLSINIFFIIFFFHLEA